MSARVSVKVSECEVQNECVRGHDCDCEGERVSASVSVSASVRGGGV